MKERIFLPVLLLLIAFSVPAAAADWRFEKAERQGTLLRAAWVENEEGYRFSLLRKNDGRVTATFELPEKSEVLLGTDPPVLRVDRRKDIPVALWGVYVDMDTRQVSWLIWDGTGDPCHPEPPAEDRKRALCEVMNGLQLRFEYFGVTGDSFQTRFSLKGSRRAIQRLLRE